MVYMTINMKPFQTPFLDNTVSKSHILIMIQIYIDYIYNKCS